MKNLLIVRSVSFQQLDLNLPSIKEAFPDYHIHLLTHEHGVKLAEKYQDIDQIHVYPYTGSFNKKNTVESIKKEEFDSIIVPVANITGAGFLNVYQYAISLKGDKYYSCNLISEIESFTAASIGYKKLLNCIYTVGTCILSLPIILGAVILLPLKLKSIEVKKNSH